MRDYTALDTAEQRRTTSPAFLAALAAVVLAVGFGCQKKAEAPSPASSSAATGSAPSASPVPTSPVEEAPSFRATAAAGEAPYAAVASPSDGAVDEQGRLWVLDSEHNRLRAFDPQGGYLGGWGGSADQGRYSFHGPEGIAIAGNTVYVSDTWKGEARAYSLKGEPAGRASGLYGPRGIAASRDAVWVTDTGNSRVMAYDAGLTNPRQIGPSGAGPGQFNGPVGIAFAPSGRVFIGDSGNGRIQVFGKDGKFVSSWSLPWLKKTWQAHVAVDRRGVVYVSNPDAGQVLAFDASGHQQKAWTEDSAGTKLVRPIGMAVGPETLYVMDVVSHKVLKIALSEAAAR